jgi:hypothetical protein
MGSYYELTIADAFGNNIGRLNQFASLQYVLRENAVGALTLTTPDVSLFNAISEDWRIRVWRSIDGGAMYQEGSGTDGALFLITQKSIATGADGLTLMSLACADAKDILARRTIDWYAGTSYTSKSAPIDDMMKAIVRENLGASGPYSGSSATGRDLVTAGVLSIQTDTSAVVSRSKAFAWRSVLPVLQEIASSASDTDALAFFDIVELETGILEFRTYANYRGVDRSYTLSSGVINPNLLIVSPDNGSLTEPSVSYDWSTEYNAVRAAGEGEGSARLINIALDQSRINRSPFARRERFLDSRNSGTSVIGLFYEAVSELLANRARVRLAGRITESVGVKYGREYRHGDLVTADAFGIRFNARVTSVTVTVDVNGETIEAALSGENIIGDEVK